MREALLLAVVLAGCSSDGGTAITDDAGADGGVDAVAEVATDVATDFGPRDSTAGADAAPETAADAADAPCTRGKRGTWAWGSDIVTKTAARDAFFEFAAKHGIGTVFVEAEGLFGASADPPSLVTFVDEARKRCIDVQMLFGYAQWLKTENHGKALALAKSALAFAKAHAGVTGTHWDVEAHQLSEWHDPYDATNEALINQYLDLLDKLAALHAGTGQLLQVDIPFWYDNRQVTRGGKRRLVSELVLEVVDVATLMDYRDTAAGPDGIIANAKTELAYATTLKKRVVVGVETLCGVSPPLITFCEEGRAKLETELATAEATFVKEPSFGGFAVHDYASWVGLKP